MSVELLLNPQLDYKEVAQDGMSYCMRIVCQDYLKFKREKKRIILADKWDWLLWTVPAEDLYRASIVTRERVLASSSKWTDLIRQRHFSVSGPLCSRRR